MNSNQGRENHFMTKQMVSYYELEGTHEEIGRRLARRRGAQNSYVPAPECFNDKELEEALALYDQYCPGIKEELISFAECLKVPVRDIAFTWMSYLMPRCSGMAVLGSKMVDGHIKLARNYEFSIEDEEIELCQIKATGSYSHIGTTTAVFGRTEGINEWGLAVAMSSCGLPVSNIEGMKAPKIKGLQFWAVIRGLLDQCKDVEEALKLALEMPIAFNINLYLADAKGNAILLETIDGHKAYKQISELSLEKYVCGTNHIVLPELQKYEPIAMKNSMVRYKKLVAFLDTPYQLTEAQLKETLLKKYPEGMSAYYYKDWFGTVKSVVMDPIEKRFSICWFGQEENGWEDYIVNEKMPTKEESKTIEIEKGNSEFFEFMPID